MPARADASETHLYGHCSKASMTAPACGGVGGKRHMKRKYKELLKKH